MNVSFRRITREKMRMLFTLHTKEVQITGQIYERTDFKKGHDQYFWSFGGKFPWECSEGFPPFKIIQKDRDISWEIYLGVPQAILQYQFSYTPVNAAKYSQGLGRSCGNCVFNQLDEEAKESLNNVRFTNQESTPRHIFFCGLTGEPTDHAAALTSYNFNTLKRSLDQNKCESHCRRAFQSEVRTTRISSMEPSDRKYNDTTTSVGWVPAEHRRLGCLPKDSISCREEYLYLPSNVSLKIQEEK